jgi:hypothetical protein
MGVSIGSLLRTSIRNGTASPETRPVRTWRLAPAFDQNRRFKKPRRIRHYLIRVATAYADLPANRPLIASTSQKRPIGAGIRNVLD